LKRRPTYDPLKLITPEMRQLGLRGEEIKRFEEEMEKFKKEHTLEIEPLPVL